MISGSEIECEGPNACLVPLCQIKCGNSAYTCFELWHKLRSVSSVTKASVETFLRSPRLGGSSGPVDSADRTAVINERTRMNKKARRTLSPVRHLNVQDSSSSITTNYNLLKVI